MKLKTIEEKAFCECGLKSVTVPKNVEIIKSNAFGMCENLTSVKIPNNVTTIEEDAFAGCSHLENIEISKKFKENFEDDEALGNAISNAFFGCATDDIEDIITWID